MTLVLSAQLVIDCQVSSSVASALMATPLALSEPGCGHQSGEVKP